jgi:hypothetical protein
MEYMKKVGKDDKILLWCDYIRTGSARDEIA